MQSPHAPLFDTLKGSKWHLLTAAALLGLAVLSLCKSIYLLAGAQIVVTDVYLLLMLWAVAQKAVEKVATRADTRWVWPGVPRRDGALLQLAMLLGAVIVGFATLYSCPGALEPSAANHLDALYFSVVTMATVGYGDIKPATDFAKEAAILQITSGMVFLAAAIPILASRLADID